MYRSKLNLYFIIHPLYLQYHKINKEPASCLPVSPRVRECSTHRSHRVRTTLFSALYCEGSLYQAASFFSESELFYISQISIGAKTNEQEKIIFYFQKPNFLYNRNIIRLSDLLCNRPIRYLRPDTILNRHRSRVF